MKLYLARHADALPPEVDPERHLSTLGQNQARDLGARLKELNIQVTYIFHSGVLRAKQTAEVIASALHPTAIEMHPGLLPEDTTDLIVDAMAVCEEDSLIVGHLPYLANLVWLLCPDCEMIKFNPTTTVCIERINTGWILKGVIQPTILS